MNLDFKIFSAELQDAEGFPFKKMQPAYCGICGGSIAYEIKDNIVLINERCNHCKAKIILGKKNIPKGHTIIFTH